MGIRRRAERGINPVREINRSTRPVRGIHNQSGVANPNNLNQNGMGNSGAQHNTTKTLREAESRLWRATHPNAVKT